MSLVQKPTTPPFTYNPMLSSDYLSAVSHTSTEWRIPITGGNIYNIGHFLVHWTLLYTPYFIVKESMQCCVVIYFCLREKLHQYLITFLKIMWGRKLFIHFSVAFPRNRGSLPQEVFVSLFGKICIYLPAWMQWSHVVWVPGWVVFWKVLRYPVSTRHHVVA